MDTRLHGSMQPKARTSSMKTAGTKPSDTRRMDLMYAETAMTRRAALGIPGWLVHVITKTIVWRALPSPLRSRASPES